MLHKCANQACANRFLRLTSGKLFRVEIENAESSAGRNNGSRKSRALRRVEHYWLCDDCATTLTLTYESNHGVVAVPLSGTIARRTSDHPQAMQSDVAQWNLDRTSRFPGKVRP